MFNTYGFLKIRNILMRPPSSQYTQVVIIYFEHVKYFMFINNILLRLYEAVET